MPSVRFPSRAGSPLPSFRLAVLVLRRQSEDLCPPERVAKLPQLPFSQTALNLLQCCMPSSLFVPAGINNHISLDKSIRYSNHFTCQYVVCYLSSDSAFLRLMCLSFVKIVIYSLPMAFRAAPSNGTWLVLAFLLLEWEIHTIRVADQSVHQPEDLWRSSLSKQWHIYLWENKFF